MAGTKDIPKKSFGGYPTYCVEVNVEKGDEWALFRLTDDGMYYYFEVGCEYAAGILGLEIKGKLAVDEVARYKTEKEAKDARSQLPNDEQHRTLIRPVRPEN